MTEKQINNCNIHDLKEIFKDYLRKNNYNENQLNSEWNKFSKLIKKQFDIVEV